MWADTGLTCMLGGTTGWDPVATLYLGHLELCGTNWNFHWTVVKKIGGGPALPLLSVASRGSTLVKARL